MKFTISQTKVSQFQSFSLSSPGFSNLHPLFSTHFQLPQIHLTIMNGSLIHIKGKNGTGKSTLFQVLLDLLPVNSGKRQLLDINHLKLSSVSHYFSCSTLPELGIGLNKESLLWTITTTSLRSLSWQLLQENLHLFELYHLQNYPLKELSLGQKNRFQLLLLSLSTKPIWILDEPTIGLDDKWTDFFYRLVSLHRQKGGIVLLATHQEMSTIQTTSLNLNTL
uniref:ABC transporter ATP-binding subunit n=1 Tax=Jakoba libera TaxID=143017 RepID=M4QA08_JAKLI|nr:ABC transporter ATP-binding subunit [Jakoba libera]AGH24196.1 ABC transporter ATP-binding subunit [Jakoba libera]